MSKKLDLIRQKIETIRYGLLRFVDGTTRKTMEVKATSANGSRLNCTIENGGQKLALLNREVNLIQKKDEDYLYISAMVDNEVKSGSKTISLKIKKAFWFTRQKKGDAEWLQEKYIYESSPGDGDPSS